MLLLQVSLIGDFIFNPLSIASFFYPFSITSVINDATMIKLLHSLLKYDSYIKDTKVRFWGNIVN